jgi:hypothetical protein
MRASPRPPPPRALFEVGSVDEVSSGRARTFVQPLCGCCPIGFELFINTPLARPAITSIARPEVGSSSAVDCCLPCAGPAMRPGWATLADAVAPVRVEGPLLRVRPDRARDGRDSDVSAPVQPFPTRRWRRVSFVALAVAKEIPGEAVPASPRARQSRDHQHLLGRHRQQRDHQHRPPPARPSRPSQHRAAIGDRAFRFLGPPRSATFEPWPAGYQRAWKAAANLSFQNSLTLIVSEPGRARSIARRPRLDKDGDSVSLSPRMRAAMPQRCFCDCAGSIGKSTSCGLRVCNPQITRRTPTRRP